MIGNKTYMQLRNMGISQVGTIQQMDVELMQRVLGENGVAIWRKANGIDNSPVVPYSERKSLSKEETFDKDTTDMNMLKKIIVRMVDALAYDLRSQQKLTSCITVKIRYSNFDTETKQARVPYTASDRILTEKALELFHKLYSRRMLIRLIGIKFSNLVHGSYQIDLFSDTIAQVNLSNALDGIRNRFGVKAVGKAIMA